MGHNHKKWLKYVALAVALGGLWLGFGCFERAVIYHPRKHLGATPRKLGLHYENVWLTSSGMTRIHGWYIPRAGASRVIVFFHGNAGNISGWIYRARLLHNMGYHVLLIDYQGFGKSQGSPSEQGTYDDAEAAWRYLRQIKKFKPKQIIIYGYSLGGGVASYLASVKPAAKLILESTFYSLPDVAARRFGRAAAFIMRTRYPSGSHVANIKYPKLIMHSKGDSIVPYASGRRLFKAAAHPKQWFELTGGHMGSRTPGYAATIKRFLRSSPKIKKNMKVK